MINYTEIICCHSDTAVCTYLTVMLCSVSVLLVFFGLFAIKFGATQLIEIVDSIQEK